MKNFLKMIDYKKFLYKILQIEFDGNLSKMASAMGVKSNYLASYFYGKANPGRKFFEKLEKAGVDINKYLLTYQQRRTPFGEDVRGKVIPQGPPIIYGASAGHFAPVFEDLNDHLDVSFLFRPGIVAVQISGSSMEGVGIFSGDILIIDTLSERRIGNIVLAREGSGITVKRLSDSSLESANEKYPHIPLTDTINIVGIVTYIIKEVK